MSSKISLYNDGIIKQSTRSAGWIAIVFQVALIFAIPLQLFMTYSGDADRYAYNFARYESLFGVMDAFQIFLVFIFPVLMGLVLLRYMQVKASADYMHSLPIKRKSLLNHNISIGLILLIVPIVVTAILTSLLYTFLPIGDYIAFSNVFSWLGAFILMVTFIFMATIFVGIMTGLTSVQGVLTYILILFPAGISILWVLNLSYFLFGYSRQYYTYSNVEYLTPYMRFMDLNYNGFSGIEITIYIGITIILFALAHLAYQRRPIEVATQAIAFRIFKPVFKYGVTFCTMLFVGMYFGEVQHQMAWIIFGYLVGSLIGYIVAEMILQKSWRIFGRLKGYGIYALCIILIGVFIQMDLFGYEKRLPNKNDIASVFLGDSIYLFEHSDRPGIGNEFLPKDTYFYKEPSNIDAIYQLHKQIIQDRNRLTDDVVNPSNRMFVIGYMLKNGDKLVREYTIPTNQYEEYLKPIYESHEYKEDHNELLNLGNHKLEKLSIQVNGPGKGEVTITDPQLIKEARDILISEINNESYEGIKSQSDQWASLQFLVDNDRHIVVPWKRSYTKFGDWLKAHDLYGQSRLMPEDISYVVVAPNNRKNPEILTKEIYTNQLNVEELQGAYKITNNKDIEKSLQSFTWSQDGDFIVAFYFKNYDDPMIAGFTGDNVPDFIKQHYK